MQHHDGITGTHVSTVTNDYLLQLNVGLNAVKTV